MEEKLKDLLNKVKTSLRLKNSAFDDEISDLISAAQSDLKNSGINDEVVDSVDDPLIIRAIIIYCHYNFGLENKDYERYSQMYHSLVNHLHMSQGYRVDKEDAL